MADWPYSTARWQKLRRLHLSTEPLCRTCGRPANTVDHVTPISEGGHPFPSHDGLASYCAGCHSRKTARGTEAGAARSTRPRGCDADGNPLDSAHPWLGGNGWLTAEAIERRMPTGLQPSRIPLTIVCGAPGSGKSTWVRERAASADRIICLDTILTRISGKPEHHAPPYLLRKALETRNAMLAKLASDTDHDHAWFIVSEPDPADRRRWKGMLGGKVEVLDTPLAECVRRIKADPTRPDDRREAMIEAAVRWWQANPHLARVQVRGGGDERSKSLRADALGPRLGHTSQLVQRGGSDG